MQQQKGFNAIKFFKDRKILYSTDHHHCSPGWVQIHCPFGCGSKNFHLGIEPPTGRVHCWRCGGHSLKKLVKELLGGSWGGVYKAIEDYSDGSFKFRTARQKEGETPRPASLEYPLGTEPIQRRHRKYLAGRGFDPDQLVDRWGLLGTGVVGPYKYRVIIPVFVEGQPVSYTGRDVTGKATLRYKDCPLDVEVKPLKQCLYGMGQVLSNKIVVVEGAADVWRLGPGAVATMGIQWNWNHINDLSSFEEVYILYDNQPQAQKQAEKLADELSYLVDTVEVINQRKGAKDPGDLTPEEAEKIMRQLTGGRI